MNLTVDFLILFYVMNKRLGKFNSGLFIYFLKVTLAALLTGIVADTLWAQWSFSDGFVKLATVGLSGFIFYGMICLFLKIEQAQKTTAWIKRGFRFR